MNEVMSKLAQVVKNMNVESARLYQKAVESNNMLEKTDYFAQRIGIYKVIDDLYEQMPELDEFMGKEK